MHATGLPVTIRTSALPPPVATTGTLACRVLLLLLVTASVTHGAGDAKRKARPNEASPGSAKSAPAKTHAPPQTRPRRESPIVRFAQGQTDITLPLTPAGDFLLVDTGINGKAAGRFIVDTGSSVTLLDKAVARRLGLPAVAKSRPRGIGRDTGLDVVELRRLVLGPAGAPPDAKASADGHLALALDLTSTNLSQGFEVAGVLASDFLRGQPFTLDLRERTLTLYDPQHFTPPAGDGVAEHRLQLRDGLLPATPGRVQDVPGWLLVDTGFAGELFLHARFVNLNHELLEAGHITNAYTPTFRGQAAGYETRLRSAEVLGRPAAGRSVWCRFNRDEGPAALDLERATAGVAGLGMMRDARITFDYAGGRIWSQWPAEEDDEEALLRRLLRDEADDVAGVTALMRAAARGREPVVRALLEQGADANAASKSGGLTPLMYAATSGRANVIDALIAGGADANAKAAHLGSTALHFAASAGHLQATQALLTGGATADVADTIGTTPLFRAAEGSHLALVELLLANGAEVDAKVQEGQYTPLVVAATRRDAKVVAALLRAGARVDAKGDDRITPLIAAARAGQAEAARLLLQSGARADARDSEGRTALMYAARLGNLEIIRALLEAGADPGLQSPDGKTAADYAADRNLNALRVLRQQSGQRESGAAAEVPSQE